MEPSIVLRPNRERSLRRRHPWIFSGGVAEVRGDPAPGDTVLVRSAGGDVLGRASYSPASQLRARMWTFDADTEVTGELIDSRIRAAVTRRGRVGADTDAVRLVFSEADAVPGLVADRYGPTVVCQLTTAGAEHWRDVMVDALLALPGVESVYERSDIDARAREGLPERSGLVRGTEPPDVASMTELGVRYQVDIRTGHKTGFYLDQRDSRAIAARLAPGRDVLNVFSYTGAFGVTAMAAGAASLTSIDSSGPALAMARRNAELNGVAPGELLEADAFTALRGLRDRARSYGLIVLDPPKLAATEAHVDKASRAYKDLNLLAAKLLAPGGVLLTFSCSGAMTAELFQKVVAGAVLDSGRTLRIVGRLGQPADHPVPTSFPEAEYLKGLVLEAE